MNTLKQIVTAAAAAASFGMALPLAAHAIDPAYGKQLEKSGCTQATELKGCDINKSREKNTKAGFGAASSVVSPYAGQWVARNIDGRTVSKIRIDGKNKVMVNGSAVKSKLSDGALVFTSGRITYTIQGDPRLQHESSWFNSDARTTGPIRRQ
ncbi:hypothetical protein KBZ19_02465 [Synechococcus sp. L2F]|uniref:hypothetical protein n=1 Tax=Synechococcus sp. L2F TaxID=2823739 RepID=UPI0020CC8988|nr:hypothetical protein [Synechococcus sp. L2F]MCP9827353.1 hypothetical protein [Synechococcus sp. L2F]